jgi:hypothetical protein
MSRYNEILVGRYNRFIQKLLGMKGPATMPQVAGELQPVLPFFNGAENRYLEGWDRFAMEFLVAAGGAGNRSVIEIRVPSGSNVICVVEKITIVSVNENPFITQTTINTDLATIQTMRRLDARTQRVKSTTVASSDNSAAATAPGGQIYACNSAASGTVDVILNPIHEIPILPGDAIFIAPSSTNVALTASIWYRERFLEDGERS